MSLRRRGLVGGRVTSGGRIAGPNADQTSRLAALERTPGIAARRRIFTVSVYAVEGSYQVVDGAAATI
jgi:hypothetical protein